MPNMKYLAHHVCIQDFIMCIEVSTVPADGLAPEGARPSADTVLTAKSHVTFKFLATDNFQ